MDWHHVDEQAPPEYEPFLVWTRTGHFEIQTNESMTSITVERRHDGEYSVDTQEYTKQGGQPFEWWARLEAPEDVV